MYYTRKLVQKCTSIDRHKWGFYIQILTKCTLIDRQKIFVYSDIKKYTSIDIQDVH